VSEPDTATVRLSKGEARKVIAALAEDEATESGRDRERLLNLQDHLAAVFGFDEHRARGGESDVPDGRDAVVGDGDLIDESDEGILNLDDDEETIELSRAEAEDVLEALSGYEGSPEDEQVVADVRERLANEFD
jgi:hypothetical protein